MTIRFQQPLTNKPGEPGSGGADDAAAKAAAAAAAAKPAEPPPAGDKAAADKATADKAAADKAAADAAAAAAKPAGQEGAGDPAKPQPPEKYELKLPDNSTLGPHDVERVKAQAKAAGLSNEDAQLILEDLHDTAQELSETYKAEAVADADYGGEKLIESQRLANSVIDRVRPEGHKRRDAFLGFIRRGGANNNVEVLAFLADIGRMMAEDSGVMGKGMASGRGDRKSHAEVLFGDAKQ